MFPSVLLDSASSTDWTQTINWTAVVLFAGAFLLASFAVLAFPLLLILAGRNGHQGPEPDAGTDAPPEGRTRPKAQEDMDDMAERARKASIAVKAAAKKQAEMEKLAAERKKAASKSAKKKSPGAPKKNAAAKAKKKAAAKTARKKTTATKKNNSVPEGAKLDPALGLVYRKKPKEFDDLKEIAGVGPVLEGKLHKTGVYTFAQVAKWSDKMATEFGERLSFRDRIFRDDWRKQAARLHKKKYGKSA